MIYIDIQMNLLSTETFCALVTDCWIVPKGEVMVA